MRKTVLLLAAAALLAAPTAASAKHWRHHRHHPVSVVTTDTGPFGPGWRVFWGGVDAVLLTPVRTVLVVTTPGPVVAKY
jgi:hypothetical protein